MDIAARTTFFALRDRIMQCIDGVFDGIPVHYLAAIGQTRSAHELYATACELRSFVNSKGNRDGAAHHVHLFSNEITKLVHRLDDLFTIKIVVNSPRQREEWNTTITRDPGATYAFRDDQSLQISLLESELDGARLHVGRIWSHVCDHGGSQTNFSIMLDPAQLAHVQVKQAVVREIQAALQA